MPSASAVVKPVVLHIGDPVQYNPGIYAKFSDQFTVIRPSTEERQRDAFLQSLRDRKWGDFQAVFRPFWNTGGEMGRWDAEMIPLLPKSLKIFASAGAGFDWADVDLLAEAGMNYFLVTNNGVSVDEFRLSQASFTAMVLLHRLKQWLIWLFTTSSLYFVICNGLTWLRGQAIQINSSMHIKRLHCQHTTPGVTRWG